MQSSERLARPQEWPARTYTTQSVVSLVGVLGMGLAALFIAIMTWHFEMPEAARYIFLFTCLLALSAAFGYLYTVRTPHGVDDIRVSNGALVIKHSSAVFGVLVALVGCTTLLCLGGAIALLIAGYRGPAILPGLLGAFFALFFVALVLVQIRRGEVALSRDGIRQRGWSFESYLPWDAIAGGKAAYNGYRMVLVFAYANATWERRVTTWPWRIDRLPPVPMFELDCRKFDVDPVLLCHLVRFYADTPAARDELGTEVPLERVRAQSF